MNDQGKKSSIQALVAGVLGFGVVVGLGSLVIFHRGGASDTSASAYPPVDADSGMAAPTQMVKPVFSGGSADGSGSSSPAPLLSDEVRAESPAPAGGAVAAASGAQASGAVPTLVVGQHLDASGSASSSASISVAAAAKVKAALAKKKPFAAPKLDLSKNQGTVASSVHYGVSDRAELMGRAAGPVYNFSGRGGGGQSAQVAADNMGSGQNAQTTAVASGQVATGAIQQMESAEKQIDASDASADEKAKLDKSLNQAVQTAAAGQ